MNICVVGTGYVGLVTGACFAELGLNVTCVDKEEEKIETLKSGEVPIYEPGLKELIRKNVKDERLSFTTNIKEGVENALAIFIAVGTPSKADGSADLSYIREVAKNIGEVMNGYKVITTKSTVPVGTGRLVEKIIKENQKKEVVFDVASNPEFLREGSAIEDFMRPDRVVVGADSDQAKAILKDLYRPLYLIEAPFIMTDIETAEMIKYASNAFLATKISFINEIANLCEKVNANVHVVSKAMGLDRRIGPKFLHPGPGYGGSCFPKDTFAIHQIAKDNDYEFKIINAVLKVNEKQRELMVEKIEKALSGLDNKKIAVWGLTFKPNTDDMRDAPSVVILNKLIAGGSTVSVYDPAGMDEAKKVFKDKVIYNNNMYDMLKGCDALVVMTEWNQFRSPDWNKIKNALKEPLIVDLRNVYEVAKMKELGFQYYSVGR